MPSYEADKQRFDDLDAQVVGISTDSIPSHVAWAESLGGISYDLLADFHPKGEVARTYGVWRDENGFSERAIFIVDREGKIAYAKVHELGTLPENSELFDALSNI